MEETKPIFPDGWWKKWSLEQKIAYVKGNQGGFNIERPDIAGLSDSSRAMQYQMKTVRMAVDVIDLLCAEIQELYLK